jgi:dynein heavy chain
VTVLFIHAFILYSVGMYSCPCYYYPNRSGTSDRDSYVVAIDIKAGAMLADHWIKRGTAILMSLEY